MADQGEHVDPRFLGGEKAVLSDTRDFALVVLVDHQGVADAQAHGVTYKQAAEWLRAIADQFASRED